jgi:hypothetical protein
MFYIRQEKKCLTGLGIKILHANITTEKSILVYLNRGPFLTSPLGTNFDPRGGTPGVHFVP